MKRATACLMLLACAGAFVLASAAQAQDARLEVQSGPYYVGLPVSLRVTASGFAPDPEPEVEFDPPGTGQLRYVGVTPQRSMSVVILNGQVQRDENVTWSFSYTYTALQPGAVELGPFRVVQGQTEVPTQSYRLRFGETPRSPQLEVHLVPDTETAYIGSPVRATLEYRVDKQLESRIVDSELAVPLFDLTDSFRFEPDPKATGRRQIDLQTGDGGVLRVRASRRDENRGGRLVSATEIRFLMIPLEAGSFTLPPASLLVREGTRFRRGLLGRQATSTRPLRAVDEVRTLVVKETPLEGRPRSFAGAVGRGFSIEVEAARTVVRAGDPVPLTVTIRGDGPLELAGLPDLAGDGGLSPEDFAVAPSAGASAGIIEDGAKRFTLNVRPKSSRVREIPALEYAYFDPRKERFEVVESKPIALSVGEAQVVGAAQVIRESDEATADVPGGGEPARDDGSASERDAAPIDLTGADLSIDRDVERLSRRSDGGVGWALRGGLYFCGLGLLGFALYDARSRRGDPARLALRKSLRAELGRMQAALAGSDATATRTLANGLRAVRAQLAEGQLSAEAAREIDALLAEADDLIFAPAGERGAGPERSGLHGRMVDCARRLADAL